MSSLGLGLIAASIFALTIMGPSLAPEIPRFSPDRLRKTRSFTPAAARLNAGVCSGWIGSADLSQTSRPVR